MVVGETEKIQHDRRSQPKQHPSVPEFMDGDLANLRQLWNVESQVRDLGKKLSWTATLLQRTIRYTVVGR